jgi:hypothetical protein
MAALYLYLFILSFPLFVSLKAGKVVFDTLSQLLKRKQVVIFLSSYKIAAREKYK